MLDFRPLTLADRSWVSPILSQSGFMGSETAFGTLYIWQEAYEKKIAWHDEMLFGCFGKSACTYFFPYAKDLKRALAALLEDCNSAGKRFRMWGVTEEQAKLMEDAWPDTFHFRFLRANADYIYRSEDLIHLAGRKYHRKRNQLTRFRREHSFTYEDITPANIAECEKIEREWWLASANPAIGGLERENFALKRSLESFSALDFKGGLIRIAGKPVAFTLGEEINSRAFVVHFEKALAGYEGLYAAINQIFAERRLASFEYINREEDMGIEGLRKAKLSYYPAQILEKAVVTLKGAVPGD
ncbi:MAG: hypothetical protein DDT20_00692 [Firmicutes bacterium]|nr:hypothetical protein [Bacillota bacterium]